MDGLVGKGRALFCAVCRIAHKDRINQTFVSLLLFCLTGVPFVSYRGSSGAPTLSAITLFYRHSLSFIGDPTLLSVLPHFYRLSHPFIGTHPLLSAFLPFYRRSPVFIGFPILLSALTLFYQLSYPFIGTLPVLSAFLSIYRRSSCFIGTHPFLSAFLPFYQHSPLSSALLDKSNIKRAHSSPQTKEE